MNNRTRLRMHNTSRDKERVYATLYGGDNRGAKDIEYVVLEQGWPNPHGVTLESILDQFDSPLHLGFRATCLKCHRSLGSHPLSTVCNPL